MEYFATKEATTTALVKLGFKPIDTGDGKAFFDSPKECDFGLPIVQASIYQCHNRYWCVALDFTGYMAPIVWNDTTADPINRARCESDFVDHLNKHFPGWR